MEPLNLQHQGCDDHVKLKEWSDKRCIEISLQEKFPLFVKDLKVQKNVISNFLNFYLSGKVRKGLNPRDLIFAVIAIMPVSLDKEDVIWAESHYSDTGHLFFLSPDDKLKVEIDSVINKKNLDDTSLPDRYTKNNLSEHTSTKTNKKSHTDVTQEKTLKKPTSSVADLSWFRTKKVQVSIIEDYSKVDYGPVENASFCTSCNRLLDQWESNVSARTTLKYFFAMAALVVMRCRVKTIQNVSKYFANKFFGDLLCTEIAYNIPHIGFIKKSWKALRELDQSVQTMFAKLVVRSYNQQKGLNNYGKENILRFAILSQTADFGMGTISMLQLIATQISYFNFKILFEGLYSEETAISWNKVNDFFKNYMCKEAKQITFHWACIIEIGQFKHLSCNNNYELAVVMAVFIEKLTGSSGIWQAAWVKSGKKLEYLKQLGCRLYEEYTEKSETFRTSFLNFDMESDDSSLIDEILL